MARKSPTAISRFLRYRLDYPVEVVFTYGKFGAYVSTDLNFTATIRDTWNMYELYIHIRNHPGHVDLLGDKYGIYLPIDVELMKFKYFDDRGVEYSYMIDETDRLGPCKNKIWATEFLGCAAFSGPRKGEFEPRIEIRLNERKIRKVQGMPGDNYLGSV